MKFARASILSLGALVAGGPALAADIITIPEPEPMEYVRVCDVYGAGFFYIPGTETCLRISGYVRYQIGATSEDTEIVTGFDAAGAPITEETNGWIKSSRARVNVDARSETEWGTLRGYIRLQGNWNSVSNSVDVDALNGFGFFGPNAATFGLSTTDGPAFVDQAWLSLGGFRAGYTDSAFEGTMNGGYSNGGSHSDDGLDYGDPTAQLIQYNFSSGGFFGTISLEDDEGDGTFAHNDYVPNVVGKVGYGGGWGAIWAVAAWDEDNSDITGLADDGAFAVKGGLHLNVPQTGGSFRAIGLYASDPNSFWDTSEWSVIASYGQDLTNTLYGSVGFQYFSDVAFVDGVDAFMVEGSLAWVPVTNFEIRTEVNYAKVDGEDGVVAGFLRFQRDF